MGVWRLSRAISQSAMNVILPMNAWVRSSGSYLPERCSQTVGYTLGFAPPALRAVHYSCYGIILLRRNLKSERQ